MRLQTAALLGMGLLAPLGCKKTVDGPMPVCASEVEGGEAEETQSQNVPPEVWFALILKSFNAKTGEAARPLKDCTGKPLEIEDEVVASCITPENPSPVLDPRALDGEKDLEITGLDDGKALVWARTDYFEDGDALGPIAIAEFRPNGIAIRAIGALRANPNRVRMRLEPMGETTVLVVDSMVCEPDDPKKCARVMRLVPMNGNRFTERPLIDDDTEACLGAATFPLSRESEMKRDGGIIRRFELVRSFDFEEGEVSVSEQLTIKDIDPEQPDAPPAVFRKAQLKRPLVLTELGLRTEESLWDRMMAEHGSVEVRKTPPPTAEDEAKEGGDEVAASADAAG
ncbi:MAG: hypothetical protein AAF799_35050 [Myxococcota bacterium]